MRLTAMIVFVMLTAAGGAAFAQSDEFEGQLDGPPADIEVERLLIEIDPEPTPVLRDDTSISRGLTPAETADLFGAVAYSADGEEREIPASPEVIEAFSGAEPSADPAGATERSVFGTDDRQRIQQAGSYPFRAAGYLSIQRSADRWSGCSGALIGPSTVITAAHCVWKPVNGQNGWPLALSFAPGSNSPNYAPYGRYTYDTIYVVTGFIQNYDPDDYRMAAVETDLAVITLQRPAGDDVGWFGYMTDPAGSYNAHILHYPGDMPDETMWRSDCTIGASEKFANHLYHYCDTYSGSSGGAMYWVDGEGRRYVRAVNVGNQPTRNLGVRLNSGYVAWINERRR